MLRYKTEARPGLVALYNIWPGNGAGQFLQPRSPHGAKTAFSCACKLQLTHDQNKLCAKGHHNMPPLLYTCGPARLMPAAPSAPRFQ